MAGLVYSSLGTSNKRRESKKDHIRLNELMDSRWESISNFNYLPPEQINEWQLARIKELVWHAFETVPLYTEKYSAVGFVPNDLKNWNDFESLPILTKDELIDSFPKKSKSSKHTFEFTTRSSGSSGRFVTLAVSPEAVYLDTIQGARQFLFQSGGNYDKTDLGLFIYTSPWWVASINGDYPTEFLPTTTTIEDSIATIERLRPKVLSIYPTYLTKLYSAGVDLSRSGVELIVIHSEQSTRQQRDEFSNFFKVPVLDEFSSEELTRIALECPHGHYHLEEDACYIEILDQKTQKATGFGKRGMIIGTNLLNEATPIIRYSQGDVATMLGNVECLCGSNFRVIKAPDGRVMDSIMNLDGDYVPASCFMDLAYNWYLELDIPVHGLKYQIVQESVAEVNVHLVPGLYTFSPSQLERIRLSMYQLLPNKVQVNVIVSEDIPIYKGEKYRPVISKIAR